jgi:hypothetical protein
LFPQEDPSKVGLNPIDSCPKRADKERVSFTGWLFLYCGKVDYSGPEETSN